MGKVSAHALSFVVGVPGGLGATRELVAKGDVVMHPVTDRLHTFPSGRRAAEQIPGDIDQLIGFAVATAQQEHQRVIGQFLNRHLPGVLGDAFGQARVFDDRVGRQAQLSGRRQNPAAPVAKQVAIGRDLDGWIGRQKCQARSDARPAKSEC